MAATDRTCDPWALLFDGEDLLLAGELRMRAIRGQAIGMVFQKPGVAEPGFTIGRRVQEALLLHRQISRRDAEQRALAPLELVRIPDPRACMDRYRHELSGGMKQRVVIAMALSCGPKASAANLVLVVDISR